MAEFVKAVAKSDLVAGEGAVVELQGKKIAIFNVAGAFYAMDDSCTHAGGPLSEGEVDGMVVMCPWHGATFDIRTGGALGPPAPDGVRTYEVKTDGEHVLVKI